MTRGRPLALRDDIRKVRDWFTSDRAKRPSGYLNHPRYFSAYSAYHLPVHLPELFWILDHFPLGAENPETILDVGCGPGTLTLSALLWLKSRKRPAPKTLIGVDLSRRALDGSERLVQAIGFTGKTKWIRQDLRGRGLGAARADWIFAGHFLNEMGSGPRVRDKKLAFIEQAVDRLNPGGKLFIIEPPLREPTLDLMWIRDQIPSHILAPCPNGVERCPLAARKLGWCYAQPPREWAGSRGLAPWDGDIRMALGIKLVNPGFSYLVIGKEPLAPREGPLPENIPAIALTDGTVRSPYLCTERGIQYGKGDFRGAPTTMRAKKIRETREESHDSEESEEEFDDDDRE